MLAEAVIELQNGNEESAVNKLNDISTKFDDTNSSELANLKLAKKYLNENDYSNAEKFFKKVVNDGGNIDFVLAAGFSGLGDCSFNSGNYSEAAKYYKKASNASPIESQKAEFLFSAAISYYEMNEVNEFKKILKTITDDYKETRINTKAEKLLATMK